MSKLSSSGLVGKQMNESREKVRRYIRLTNLIPELLNYVDDKHSNNIVMGVSQGVEFSYLTESEQKLVAYFIEYELVVPSHGQAIKIRKISEKKKLTYEKIEELLREKKGNQNERITFNKQKIEEVLPFDLVKRGKRYIEAYIIEAIKEYKNHHRKKDLLDFK